MPLLFQNPLNFRVVALACLHLVDPIHSAVLLVTHQHVLACPTMLVELQTVDLSALSMQNALATWLVKWNVVGILARDLVGQEQSVEW